MRTARILPRFLRLRRFAGASNALAVMTTQAITAGGSLILQMIAARELGLSGYGAFAICLAILTTIMALYTGYVGDALTVMDRRDPVVRGALTSSAFVGLALAFVASGATFRVLHLGTLGAAAVFAALITLWLIEETGRRILIVRLEMWRLVGNDATYMGITFAALIVALLGGAHVTLTLLIGSMAVGCAAAVVLALFQIEAEELRGLRPHARGVRDLARFATWRSLQATLRPTQVLAARLLVSRLVSLGAVGAVESGRLVVAPIQTLLNGASAFLLATGADSARNDRHDHERNSRVAWALLCGTLACGLGAAMLSHPLGSLMTGRPVPHLLVLGWSAYLAMWAASLPFTAELVVRKLSWPVFLARLVETAAGVAAITAVLLAGGSAQTVPWLLAAPALINAWALRRMAVRSRTGVGHPQSHWRSSGQGCELG